MNEYLPNIQKDLISVSNAARKCNGNMVLEYFDN